MPRVRGGPDPNLEVANALADLALVHSSQHARFAYKRAARSIRNLDTSLTELAREGVEPTIPYVGPSSRRIVREVLEHGRSETVERAVDEAGKREAITAARALRTNFLSRAEALRILRAPAEGIVRREDCLGDLQMHTRWSDGAESPEAMAEAGLARGYRYIAVTDHSYGLPIAGGMSMEEVTRQHREIEQANRRFGDRFRILRGIEANIRADGTIDMTREELERFDLVVAAPHSALRKAFDQTDRMLAAVRQPAVRILGHPRGRMMTRPGVQARWDEVFEEAARLRVAVELDGDPWRQDLDHSLARRALDAGCLFALDSDAHSGAELRYSDYAIAHARRAGIPAERVVNCWPLDPLLAWARERPEG